MVAYKKSAASAVVLGAAAASAQMMNGTAIVLPQPGATTLPGGTGPTTVPGTASVLPQTGATTTFTTIIPSLCPTGLVDIPYTIMQYCPYGVPCSKPAVPYGWHVTTRLCAHGCGSGPKYVPVTECPWATPTPAPTNTNGYNKDEVICPGTVPGEVSTYTHWWNVPVQTPCTTEGGYTPPVYTPPPMVPGEKPQPPPYYPETPGKPYHPEGNKPQPPSCEEGGYCPPSHPEGNKPMPPSCEEGGYCPPTPPPACVGPYCPDMVTKPQPPPTKQTPPCNTTGPIPPMYTGAGVKVAASGVVGFVLIAAAAFL